MLLLCLKLVFSDLIGISVANGFLFSGPPDHATYWQEQGGFFTARYHCKAIWLIFFGSKIHLELDFLRKPFDFFNFSETKLTMIASAPTVHFMVDVIIDFLICFIIIIIDVQQKLHLGRAFLITTIRVWCRINLIFIFFILVFALAAKVIVVLFVLVLFVLFSNSDWMEPPSSNENDIGKILLINRCWRRHNNLTRLCTFSLCIWETKLPKFITSTRHTLSIGQQKHGMILTTCNLLNNWVLAEILQFLGTKETFFVFVARS